MQFIKDTLDAGIVHSICSKNDFDVAMEKLHILGIDDCFVFPSINWEPKGTRIKAIISTMNLRPSNVLFIDDNIQNLQEAEFYNEDIMTALPELIREICPVQIEKKDLQHTRLAQYKVLEEKTKKATEFADNNEFLRSCNIRVEINEDCMNHLDRLYELNMRSNQLNYTKNRQSKEELAALFADKTVSAGYVSAKDNFGDYGIVGFYAVKDSKAIHYCFSCRTLGMLVEQYVYVKIGAPQLDVQGSVVTQLNDSFIPDWINSNSREGKKREKTEFNKSIIWKGPCDIQQIFSFIKDDRDTVQEFTYTNDDGYSIEGHNYTAQIVSALQMTAQRKAEITSEFVWLDSKMYDTKLTEENFDYLILSMVTDASLGLYRRKDNGEYLAYYSGACDITRAENWKSFENNILKVGRLPYSMDDMKRFSEIYEFVPDENFSVSVKSLESIYDYLAAKGTKLILILPTERKYPGETSAFYKNREKKHQVLNGVVRQWANGKTDVFIMPIDKYITDDRCFLDTLNHFTKSVYYRMAEDLAGIIGINGGIKGKGTLWASSLEQWAVNMKRKITKRIRG